MLDINKRSSDPKPDDRRLYLKMFTTTSVLWSIWCFFVNCECDYPFRDPNLPWNDRVNDLITRLTVSEIILQLSKGGTDFYGGPAPAIDRLGIQPYQWNTECLRGDAQAGNATAFPQAIGLASSWSPSLIHRVAAATSTEVRAKHNNFVQHGEYGDHTGLSCFSPVINIMRHPLWGRNQETYGEDPFLSGTLAQHFVKGLHGDHPRYVRASSGCKHFDVHGGPEWQKFAFDAEVSERDWVLTFRPAFKMCVEAGTYSVMCSYNRINGIPACANKKLLTDILRKEWGFDGYVVSDLMAIENIFLFHKYIMDPVEVAARCVEAGTNLELSSVASLLINITFLRLNDAVTSGRISPKLLYERARPLFYTRMRLGEFDPPSMNPYTNLDLSAVLSVEHQNLAREAASKSFVLLKNSNILPLKQKMNTIAIVGPMADNPSQLFGDYAPEPDPRFITTPLNGLRRLAQQTVNASGCLDGTPCRQYDAASVVNVIQRADLVIVCLGTGQDVEMEDRDRQDMELPGKQADLLHDVLSASARPVLVLLFSASPLNITGIYSHEKIAAILQCSFPAQATGLALYDTLTLATPDANPAARLPYTWYKSLDDVASIRNYTMEQRTYRYYDGAPLYPFGYGLSYTKFNYSNLVVRNPFIKVGEDLHLSVEVENVGNYDGDEVVQVYIRWDEYKRLQMPRLQLVAFTRLRVDKAQRKLVPFTVNSTQMAVWSPESGFTVEPNQMTVFVGGQQPEQETRVDSNVLTAKFAIVPATQAAVEEEITQIEHL